MIELQISNYLYSLVTLSEDIKSYHRGYIEEIGINQDNAFDQDLELGKQFPHLQMLPGEGVWELKDGGRGNITVELRLYDLEEHDQEGELPAATFRTRGEKWYKLKMWMGRILWELQKGRFDEDGVKTFGIPEGARVEWFEDVDVAINTLIYVGVKFTISYMMDCSDLDVEFNYNTLPEWVPYPIEGHHDYEELRAPEEIVE